MQRRVQARCDVELNEVDPARRNLDCPRRVLIRASSADFNRLSDVAGGQRRFVCDEAGGSEGHLRFRLRAAMTIGLYAEYRLLVYDRKSRSRYFSGTLRREKDLLWDEAGGYW